MQAVEGFLGFPKKPNLICGIVWEFPFHFLFLNNTEMEDYSYLRMSS